MTVVDDKGLPASDVKVRMKESWESYSRRLTSNGDTTYFRREWESELVPWYEAVTDAKGKAVIVMEITALDHTKKNEPPGNRDWISNRQYMARLHGANAEDEILIDAAPGEHASGRSYTLTIDEIEKPVYVPTPTS